MVTQHGTIGNWQPPQGSGNCPNEETLNEWIRNPESPEAKAHLEECAACRVVVGAARQTSLEENRNLQAFMLNVRLRAQEEAAKNTSKWQFIKNYFRASYIQMASAAAAIIAVALIAITSITHYSSLQPGQTADVAAPVILNKSDNREAMQQALAELRTSYSAIANGDTSKGETVMQIQQINQTLSKVNSDELLPDQKQQLEALKTQYQFIVFDRFQPKVQAPANPAKAQLAQSEFFNSYASRLAEVGQPLTLSPDVTFKPNGTKLYILPRPETAAAKDLAANQAVHDLQSRLPGISVEYKSADVPVSATASSANSHSD
jgi:hypothetical protein